SAEVRSDEDGRYRGDRRWVAIRADFLAWNFRAVAAHSGFHAHPGAQPDAAGCHGQNSSDARPYDSQHDDQELRLSARLRLPGREILRGARWRRLRAGHDFRKRERPDYWQH